MKTRYIILFLFLGILLSGCSNENIQNDFLFKEYTQGEKILLHNINGGSKTLIRTKNGFIVEGEEKKILMFDFFGTFCQPCKEEASTLTKLWKNNLSSLNIIGLTHFETVSDEEVKKFADDYGSYYFLSNNEQNNRIIAQILKDIDYQNMEQLPFKVVLKQGEYQVLSDFWKTNTETKYYLGKVPISVMQEDLNRITKEK
ncbi:TlpA family protein disulfide reductase [Campylobacter sp. MIT 21-1685]|uniref:TlpA family protein disulfide reductase n=1 Tax=unclassified Campylobacter TaxID=2593542 RepID=UPI00224B23A3|nr:MULTISPECIES: TlpA family protein disulfide reductase [unclassified Campylobacter]MCX2682422.1 TlpA family protein disulfide reductase [Campylobacter sp. MIT 21-1684]MCX2750702.1 TlpA family protein disulfide reductase [Campylobacter sp. MIT 21-1682]MCX2806750.1 TlpA family protein disulfide reductase [Campylobacter sp. MIT 21-1685]